MRVLVVGSGGREHALCWALAASPLCDFLACAPGNGGIADVATCVDIGVMDFDGLITYCGTEAIEFVVVGPEAPLAAGLVDRLDAAGIKSFGPSAAAAVLEVSKGFTKDLCAKHGIPTGRYGRFRKANAAKAFAADLGAPVVVKADGLAAGKGVVIAETLSEAENAIDAILDGQFGDAGAELVVEEFLEGEEASFFALVDGEHILPLASAQDHKAVGEGDTGPNTGGMGAYSPAPIVSEDMAEDIMARIVRPTVAAMAAEGRPFKGVLYAGLMITAQGPQLLEYNVRFGDPECQVLMLRLKSDLLPLLLAASDGVLNHVDARWHDESALCVVIAAKGYPGAYDKGTLIGDLAQAEAVEGVTIFHAGTAAANDGLVATGGRVLGVTALGGTVAAAQRSAYAAVDRIDWSDGFCRRDIGWRAVGELAHAESE